MLAGGVYINSMCEGRDTTNPPRNKTAGAGQNELIRPQLSGNYLHEFVEDTVPQGSERLILPELEYLYKSPTDL